MQARAPSKQVAALITDDSGTAEQSFLVDTLSSDELNRSIVRIRAGITDFNVGTRYEITALFLSALRRIDKITKEDPAAINPAFELVVLQTLSDLIKYYTYHRETVDRIGNPRKFLPGPQSYVPSLFTIRLWNRTNQAFNLDRNSTTLPEDILREGALLADKDSLSHIYICRDPYCRLTMLDPASATQYSQRVGDMIKTIDSQLKALENAKLTWICFGAGNLGLTVMRLINSFGFWRREKPHWPRELEVVLIDKGYTNALKILKNPEEKSINADLKIQVKTDHTKIALMQFCQFLATQVPDQVKLTVHFCDSDRGYADFMQKKPADDRDKCLTYLEADDLFLDGGSTTEYKSEGAEAEFNHLLSIAAQYSCAGAFLSVFKDDPNKEVILDCGQLDGSEKSRTILTTTIDEFNAPQPARNNDAAPKPRP